MLQKFIFCIAILLIVKSAAGGECNSTQKWWCRNIVCKKKKNAPMSMCLDTRRGVTCQCGGSPMPKFSMFIAP
uniref:Uncharacterized protein n=1 Tax=Isometrus maculatus TaxID=497827 RepID=A0A0U1SEY9_ISOMC|nr:hypothetical protein [Isometrus maculatus]